MKKNIHTWIMAISALFIMSCGDNTPDDSKEAAREENREKFDADMRPDYKFAEEAADDGMLEVQAGELARTNASSAEVKAFAEQMVTDHSAANNELKELCASKNISIPASLSERNQDKYGQLAKKTGTDFDEAYTDMMVKEHRRAVNLFEKEADRGNDADLKAWAAGKLPTLRHHLQMAEELEDKMDDEDDNDNSTVGNK